jgi:hypothetical protein
MAAVRTRTPWSFALAVVYVVAALGLTFIPVALEPNNALAVVGGVFMTMPWSIVLTMVLDAVAPSSVGSLPVALGTLVLGALMNAVVIYFGAAFIERKLRRRH